MKPFNKEAALAGAPVVTVNGDPVTGFHLFDGVLDGEHRLFGVLDGFVESWSDDGRFHFAHNRRDSPLDLRMADDDQGDSQ